MRATIKTQNKNKKKKCRRKGRSCEWQVLSSWNNVSRNVYFIAALCILLLTCMQNYLLYLVCYTFPKENPFLVRRSVAEAGKLLTHVSPRAVSCSTLGIYGKGRQLVAVMGSMQRVDSVGWMQPNV